MPSVVRSAAAAGAGRPGESSRRPLALPWRAAGLTEREAAVHVLNRFAFGPRPGEVDRLLAQGVEDWVGEQLRGELAEPKLLERLSRLDALALPVREFPVVYPRPGVVVQLAQEAGVLTTAGDREEMATDLRRRYRRKLGEFAEQRGFRAQAELVDQARAQKLLRALHSENQLREVLTDFWFNHFNVSVTDNQALSFVLSYERDAVRPYVLRHFRELLGATAKHPAMLYYLDNALSVAPRESPTTMGVRADMQYRRSGARAVARLPSASPADEAPPAMEKSPGLNENYARELLELHTLGVDGGYTQQDVIEVARAFTGWRPYPAEEIFGEAAQLRIDRALELNVGFVVEGGFVFRADAHDAGEKSVLGQRLPAGRGIEDGEEVLDLLTLHPSTARHLAGKLAAYFVCEAPPAPLVERLADRLLASRGDLAEMMQSLVESAEFWSREHVFAKIKSPFELAVSALRALDAELGDPKGLADWVARMGQPLYACQAPTGYPDAADHWVNAGALLTRMNFGLALAAGRVDGTRIDLAALHGGVEPESREAALRAYLPLLLPERDVAAALELLRPVVTDPDVPPRVAEAAGAGHTDPMGSVAAEEMEWMERPRGPRAMASDKGLSPTPLEQVVGVILGAPDFQRR